MSLAELPPPPLAERVGRVMGTVPVVWTRARGGWTNVARWVVRFGDGTSAFVKAATDADTAAWLRAEHHVYTHLSGPFLPALLGWEDADGLPVLVLEDLSGAHWPPPWTTAGVDAVLAALEAIHAAPHPPGLGAFEDERSDFARWGTVAADPEPFLLLGFCSAGWLEAALPALIAAEAEAVLDGDDLLHLDVRSDNLCLPDDNRAILVDWNWATRGNGLVDIAGWLPSLHAEGGPPPEAILPGQPALAAIFAGFWASRAGLPPSQPGSRVREVQRKQLRAALPWAARALGLPPPDGERL